MKDGTSVVLGAMLGAMIWFLSPLATNSIEPWDAISNAWYYPVSLLAAGFAGIVLSCGRFWVVAIGVWFGQGLYQGVLLEIGPLWLVGIGVAGLYSLLALLTAYFGAGFRLVKCYRDHD